MFMYIISTPGIPHVFVGFAMYKYYVPVQTVEAVVYCKEWKLNLLPKMARGMNGTSPPTTPCPKGSRTPLVQLGRKNNQAGRVDPAWWTNQNSKKNMWPFACLNASVFWASKFKIEKDYSLGMHLKTFFIYIYAFGKWFGNKNPNRHHHWTVFVEALISLILVSKKGLWKFGDENLYVEIDLSVWESCKTQKPLDTVIVN